MGVGVGVEVGVVRTSWDQGGWGRGGGVGGAVSGTAVYTLNQHSSAVFDLRAIWERNGKSLRGLWSGRGRGIQQSPAKTA